MKSPTVKLSDILDHELVTTAAKIKESNTKLNPQQNEKESSTLSAKYQKQVSLKKTPVKN